MEQYISKTALVAEIKRLIAFYSKEIEDNKEDPWAMDIAKRDILQEILSFLDTLEVKEMDLEKEANECWNYVFSELGWDKNSIITMKHDEFMAFAKHFFELGLSVNNPITAADRGTAEEIIINLKRVE